MRILRTFLASVLYLAPAVAHVLASGAFTEAFDKLVLQYEKATGKPSRHLTHNTCARIMKT